MTEGVRAAQTGGVRKARRHKKTALYRMDGTEPLLYPDQASSLLAKKLFSFSRKAVSSSLS